MKYIAHSVIIPLPSPVAPPQPGSGRTPVRRGCRVWRRPCLQSVGGMRADRACTTFVACWVGVGACLRSGMVRNPLTREGLSCSSPICLVTRFFFWGRADLSGPFGCLLDTICSGCRGFVTPLPSPPQPSKHTLHSPLRCGGVLQQLSPCSLWGLQYWTGRSHCSQECQMTQIHGSGSGKEVLVPRI